MREAGYTPWERLDFDLAVNAFGERFESEQRRTKEVSDTAPRRRRRTKVVPYHSRERLNEFLSLPLHLLKPETPDQDPEVQELVEQLRKGTPDWLLNPMASAEGAEDPDEGGWELTDRG